MAKRTNRVVRSGTRASGGSGWGKNTWLIIPASALLHLAATFAAVFASFAATGRSWDDGTPLSPSDQLVVRVAEVLVFPMYPVAQRLGIGRLGAFGDLLFVANSLLWAMVLYLFVELCQSAATTRDTTR
jgi:hypothetical protein